MPKQNFEVVREAVRANRSGTPENTTDIVLSLCDPAIEFRSRVAAIEGASYRGHEGIRRYLDDMADAWREWRNELEEIVELRPDTVLAEICFHGTGRASGAAIELRIAGVCVLSGGKLVRIHMYRSREEALKAVDLAQ